MNTSVFDDAINDIIVSNVPYSVIQAGTGVGKSTILPIKLVCKSPQKYKVFVVTPTIEGVRNMYDRVSKNQVPGCNVNFSVGYSANYEVKYSNYKISHIRKCLYGTNEKESGGDTQLVFFTIGSFLNVLKDSIKYIQQSEEFNPRTLGICDFIIFDEPHKHSMNGDIALNMLKYLIRSFDNKNVPRVICTSATYAEDKLYKITLPRMFTVTEEYPLDFPEDLSIDQRIQTIGNIVADNLSKSRTQSTAIVFLPGIREILMVKNIIESNGFNCEIVVAHSKSSDEEKRRIYTGNKPGQWKIILATNIIEQSTTVDGATVIFDSMIEKFNESGPNDTVFLKYGFISKDSAEQRKGRLGRTRDGIIFRMMTRKHFDKLEQSISPEIKRLPIINELLMILDCNIDAKHIFGDIDNKIERKFSEEQFMKIDKTFRILTFYGALIKCDDYYRVTDLGRFLSNTSLSIKSKIFIYKWLDLNYPAYPGIVIAVMLENANLIFENLVPSEFQSVDPLVSIILPWLKLCSAYGTLTLKEGQLNNFCKKHEIKYDGMADSHRKIKEVIMRLSEINGEIEIFMFDPIECFTYAKPILSKLYFNYKIKKDANALLYVNVNDKIRHPPLFLNKRFLTYNETKPPEKIVGIINMHINGRSQVLLWFPCEYNAPKVHNNTLSVSEIVENDDVDDEELNQSDEEFTSESYTEIKDQNLEVINDMDSNLDNNTTEIVDLSQPQFNVAEPQPEQVVNVPLPKIKFSLAGFSLTNSLNKK